ncbi:uncharacterized protein BDR25DRAFT_391360 [Lindgomyces ingoldianus]|uniref:Uncharacterized protein n=1 Tax=Lindgomyces ingoldianus TaxID=673940 RepID=A0ACB6R9S2_9PLEO|nr:uncharacterized protein BDR25DRAFT_391360 [Lindgomyces ingoldianus]KAF2476073.1 hypothetical protein BDR25DRAFT_391360 [Lindgomyces ingoldianus]
MDMQRTPAALAKFLGFRSSRSIRVIPLANQHRTVSAVVSNRKVEEKRRVSRDFGWKIKSSSVVCPRIRNLKEAPRRHFALPNGFSRIRDEMDEGAFRTLADVEVADPRYHMRYRAELGDKLTSTIEVNIAENAQAHAAGWEETAWDGIQQTIDILAQKRIKVIINGGAHKPKGLSEKVHQLVTKKNLLLKVAYVLGDNLINKIKDIRSKGLPPHLDSDNSEVHHANHTLDLLKKGNKPVISANAYLGAREIVKGLKEGADIIIAGSVADASPVCVKPLSSHTYLRFLHTLAPRGTVFHRLTHGPL